MFASANQLKRPYSSVVSILYIGDWPRQQSSLLQENFDTVVMQQAQCRESSKSGRCEMPVAWCSVAMLLLQQVYLAARLQLVRPWPEANGKDQSLVTNVRSLGCSENPLEAQEHFSFLQQEPCNLGMGMISRPETSLLVFELTRKRKTFCLWAFMWHQSCSHLFQPWQPGQGNSGVFSQEEEGISSCGLPKITSDFGPV